MNRPVILCVDDNPDDLLLLKFACETANLSLQLQFAEGGDEAIQYLAGLGRFADRERSPMPHVVVLDLKMPGKSGFDVLAWIRSQDQLQNLPVLVFTASTHPEDKTRAFEQGASDYAVKPVDFGEMHKFLRALVRLMTLSDAGDACTVTSFEPRLRTSRSPETRGCLRTRLHPLKPKKNREALFDRVYIKH